MTLSPETNVEEDAPESVLRVVCLNTLRVLDHLSVYLW